MNSRSGKHYLHRPYARIVIPDEGGGYHAEILEFPGCYAQGESPDDAYKNLEEAAEAWIEVCLDKGQTIPDPSSSLGYGGNVLLRLPRSIHRQAAKMAARDRTSLNQYLLAAVSARVGADDFYNVLVRQFEQHLVATFTAFTEATYAWWKNYRDAMTPATINTEIVPGPLLSTASTASGREQSTAENPRR
jgi:predicted RNase H-like HicB family nuclease